MKVDCRESECGGPAKQALHLDFTLPPVPSAGGNLQHAAAQGARGRVPHPPRTPLGQTLWQTHGHMLLSPNPSEVVLLFLLQNWKPALRNIKRCPPGGTALKNVTGVFNSTSGPCALTRVRKPRPAGPRPALSGRSSPEWTRCVRLSRARWTHGC